MKKELTQKYLKEILNYNPNTGIFTWKLSKALRVNKGDIAGGIDNHGYGRIGVDGKSYRKHKLIWLYVYGKFPKDGNEVDHINHDKIDNRLVNLREVTRSENQRNRTRQKNNTSGFTGVYFHTTKNKWNAKIRNSGKNIHLGYFEKIKDAIKARKKAIIKYGFHPNHGK